MSLESIRNSIVSSLEGISGLRVHDHVPDSMHEFPAVSGASSIRAALEVDPGSVTLEVNTIERRRINGVPYMTAQITVRALDTP